MVARQSRSIGIALVCLLGSSAGRAVAQRTAASSPSLSPCYPPGGFGDVLLGSLKHIVGGRDSITASERRIAALPSASPDIVSTVTDSATCASMLAAYRTQSGFAPESVRHVYVFRVGTVYVVVDPKVQAGEWELSLTLDSTGTKVLARVFE